MKTMRFRVSTADYLRPVFGRNRLTIGLIWTPPVLAGVFFVMASRCGCSLISGLRLQSSALRGPMKSAEEGLIFRKDSKSKVRFRHASPRSDLFRHHENDSCFNPVGCLSS